jgi:hypothetical protein
LSALRLHALANAHAVHDDIATGSDRWRLDDDCRTSRSGATRSIDASGTDDCISTSGLDGHYSSAATANAKIESERMLNSLPYV